MLTGVSFTNLWGQIVDFYSSSVPELKLVNLNRMATMVLGIDHEVGAEHRFYREIVNGPFDADKLDYLPRDGYFTGLSILVDIERLLHTVTVIEEEPANSLGVFVSGSSVLEQIIFARTQLYTSIYHHHKVRAAHKLIEGLLQTMLNAGYKPAGYDLADPTSYTMLDDYDILHSRHNHPILDRLVRRIKTRNLPKRALVVTFPCFDEGDEESRENVDKLSEQDIGRIEKIVEEELHLSRGEVMFDIPAQPRLYGTGQALVKIAPNKTLLLQDIYPAGAWAKAYAGYRKVAYVFTTSHDRRRVGEVARNALASLPYPIKLNDNSLVLAKLD